MPDNDGNGVNGGSLPSRMIRPSNPMIRPSKLSDPSPAPTAPGQPITRSTRLTSMLEAKQQSQRLQSRVGDEQDQTAQQEQEKPMLLPQQGANVDGDSVLLGDARAFKVPAPRDYNTALKLFRNNVVELRFRRRTTSSSRSTSNQMAGQMRRMLCTSDWRTLNSIFLRKVFGFTPPKGTRRGTSWYKLRGLLITWDLVVRDFRIISLDEWDILGVVPLNTIQNTASFIIFYNETLSRIKGNNQMIYFSG